MSRLLSCLRTLLFLRFSNPTGKISQYDTSNFANLASLGKVNIPSRVMMRKFRETISSSRDEVSDVLIDNEDINISEMEVLLRFSIVS